MEFTVRDGTAELQQAAEGQGGHVRLPPAICLLLHVLFKLDPASSLLPAHFMILLHNQLVQFHKQLRKKIHTNHSEDLWRLGVKVKVFLWKIVSSLSLCFSIFLLFYFNEGYIF